MQKPNLIRLIETINIIRFLISHSGFNKIKISHWIQNNSYINIKKKRERKKTWKCNSEVFRNQCTFSVSQNFNFIRKSWIRREIVIVQRATMHRLFIIDVWTISCLLESEHFPCPVSVPSHLAILESTNLIRHENPIS